jgi:hypothetical protein
MIKITLTLKLPRFTPRIIVNTLKEMKCHDEILYTYPKFTSTHIFETRLHPKLFIVFHPFLLLHHSVKFLTINVLLCRRFSVSQILVNVVSCRLAEGNQRIFPQRHEQPSRFILNGRSRTTSHTLHCVVVFAFGCSRQSMRLLSWNCLASLEIERENNKRRSVK